MFADGSNLDDLSGNCTVIYQDLYDNIEPYSILNPTKSDNKEAVKVVKVFASNAKQILYDLDSPCFPVVSSDNTSRFIQSLDKNQTDYYFNPAQQPLYILNCSLLI
jgi:hypothetical protein